MNKKMAHVLWFKDLGLQDVPLVGGKNASLGEMYANLTKLGIAVPNGFAITASAYRYFLSENGLEKRIRSILKNLNTKKIAELKKRGRLVRELILAAAIPADLQETITQNYRELGKLYKTASADVAVRSSATAEDLPGASFAGQQETFLNVKGVDHVLWAVKACFASLFTDRAISYRADKGFSHFDIALSVAVQKMIRSDLGSSGVAFTIDTESGFDKIVQISGIWGLGELIVQGKIIPDEFLIFKPSLEKKLKAIISRTMGKKSRKLVYGASGTREIAVPKIEQAKYCLTDAEVLRLAKWCVQLEKYFSKKYRQYQPMDIEWAKDGKSGKLYIVQARPETVHSVADKNIYRQYRLAKTGTLRISGAAVGTKIATGRARIIRSPKQLSEFKKGEILVTEITDPDWEPLMKIAAGIITDKGGRTSHAAIVSRELGIPAIVGAGNATRAIKNGEWLTMDCSSGEIGKIYKGRLPFQVIEHSLNKIPKTHTSIMVNIGSPDEAFKYHSLPVQGVGLGRLEFIINSHIRIHPNALIDYQKIKARTKNRAQKQLISQIDRLTAGYSNKTAYYIDKLSEGIARIGAAFWPNKVIIRFSDFKTNEYRTLVGGELYEPWEENPMIGWRGASRYYHPDFEKAFALECRAMKKVREEMGLRNVIPMIPFCRTVEEGKKTLAIMRKNGLRKSADMPVYVMCEIPSNVILADEFLKIFDGMSIGSNDLSQLTLGLDRDSGIVSRVGNENNPAVKALISQVVGRARALGKYSGLCGQAPSDYPDFAKFLVSAGIESISLNPDSVIQTTLAIAKEERTGKRKARKK